MSQPTSSSTARFAAALQTVVDELDWEHLGHLYCDEGGESFFPPAQRDAIVDAGLHFAADLGEALTKGPSASATGAGAGTGTGTGAGTGTGTGTGTGRSLYFGAALAELAPILFESLVLEREIAWTNLEGDEVVELERVLGHASSALGFDLPRVDTSPGLPSGPFDHVWCVSVFTDPTHFPALHDELYRRRGTPLATRRGKLRKERERAKAAVTSILERTTERAWLSTTDEELQLFRSALETGGRALAVPERGRLSPIVGDVVRMCRLRRQ